MRLPIDIAVPCEPRLFYEEIWEPLTNKPMSQPTGSSSLEETPGHLNWPDGTICTKHF